MNTDPKAAERYIKRFTGVARERLEQARAVILRAAPGAEERLSYGMPAYFVGGKVVIYMAAHAKHLGIYPGKVAKGELKELLGKYISGASTAKFPYDQPLPEELIEKLVRFRVGEVTAKGA